MFFYIEQAKFSLVRKSCKKYALFNPLNPDSAKWHLQILLCLTPDDFTLSNARRFSSSMENPLGVIDFTLSNARRFSSSMENPLGVIDFTLSNARRFSSSMENPLGVIDFTLSNARRFYSSMENPLGVKGLKNGQTLLLRKVPQS